MPDTAELSSSSVEESVEPTNAELAATAASVAEVLEPTTAAEVEEDQVSEPASSPSSTAAPRTRPTSASEEDS